MSSEKKEHGRSVYTAWNHPLVMRGYFDVPELYEWQKEVIEMSARERSRVCVSTNNESGKTNIIIPLLGLSAMVAFPGCTVFSTAGAEEQIKGQLFKYLEEKLRRYIGSGKDSWQVSMSELQVMGPEVGGVRSRWISRVPKDALTVEGYHGHWSGDKWCPVMVIVDEAKSVGREIFEAAWRIDPDWLVVISTPGDDSGPFYEAMEDLANREEEGGVEGRSGDLWTYRRKVNWRECPHLLTDRRLALREALIKKFGENHSFIKSFLGGEFKRSSDENYAFTDNDIRNVRQAMGMQANDDRRGECVRDGVKRASLDFSGGGDEQTIYIRDGMDVYFWRAFKEENTTVLARMFVNLLKEHKVEPWNCYADNGGLGLPIIDAMENMSYQGIHRYMNQQASVNKHEYADRMTEDLYKFKGILARYRIKLPNDPVLLKQARQRRSKMNNHNQVKLEDKPAHRARTGESPDRLDGIVMLFSDFEAPVVRGVVGVDIDDIKSDIEIKAQQGGHRAFQGLVRAPVSGFGKFGVRVEPEVGVGVGVGKRNVPRGTI